MNDPVTLHGYQFSVYTRIARVALHEKGVAYEQEEVDPFSEDVLTAYLELHPFQRVPVLSHGPFDLYETAAITRYVDAVFEGPDLVPKKAEAIGRMAQVVSIVDSYAYRPMVRQVFSHSVFRPALGVESDEVEITAGLQASMPVLNALNKIVQEGHVLDGARITLADCHLAPMVAYFFAAREGAACLSRYSALADWWGVVSQRQSLIETIPGLPSG